VFLAFVASLAFWIFFQVSKSALFAPVNPFAEDPPDAVGSIAFQLAFLLSLVGMGLLALFAGVVLVRARTALAQHAMPNG